MNVAAAFQRYSICVSVMMQIARMSLIDLPQYASYVVSGDATQNLYTEASYVFASQPESGRELFMHEISSSESNAGDGQSKNR